MHVAWQNGQFWDQGSDPNHAILANTGVDWDFDPGLFPLHWQVKGQVPDNLLPAQPGDNTRLTNT